MGEKFESARFIVPRLRQLIQIQRTADAPVQNIDFSNISFRHTTADLPPEGTDNMQAGSGYLSTFLMRRDSTLDLDEAKHAGFSAVHLHGGNITGCEFTQMGKHGVQIGSGSRKVIVVGSRIADCGANGVNLGTPAIPTTEAEYCLQNRVIDCLVERTGRVCAGAVGIWQGFAAEGKIGWNRIRNLPYTGISMGWRWDDTPTMAHGNRIVSNHISDVMLLLGDGGGIYTLGSQPGSVVEKNLVHAIHRSASNAGSPNNGIYPDQGSTGIVYRDNIVFDIVSSPVRCHGLGGLSVEFTKNTLVPGEGQSAGMLSPPYEGYVHFRKESESIDPRVKWTDNIILSFAEWAKEEKQALDNLKAGHRQPRAEKLSL